MDELEARDGDWAQGVNEEGGKDERVIAMVEEKEKHEVII